MPLRKRREKNSSKKRKKINAFGAAMPYGKIVRVHGLFFL